MSELMCLRKKNTFNEKVENNLCFDGERYYVKLPFTKLFGQIPCNFSIAFTRLKSLKVELQNNGELKGNYYRGLSDHKSYGIIEKFYHIAEPAKVHYLPTHCSMVKNNKAALTLEWCLVDPLIL